MTPEYRRVAGEDSPRPVALIVICDACGNTELAWAWHDHGEVFFWTRHPLLAGLFKARGKQYVDVPRKPVVWTGPVRVEARCRDHRIMTAAETVDPAELSPATTRRIRATRSTAQ